MRASVARRKIQLRGMNAIILSTAFHNFNGAMLPEHDRRLDIISDFQNHLLHTLEFVTRMMPKAEHIKIAQVGSIQSEPNLIPTPLALVYSPQRSYELCPKRKPKSFVLYI